MVTIPYSEAVRLWRGGDNVWLETPRNARPAWINNFRREKLPESIIMKTTEDPSLKTVMDLGGGLATSDMLFEFDYYYDAFQVKSPCSLPLSSSQPALTFL